MNTIYPNRQQVLSFVFFCVVSENAYSLPAETCHSLCEREQVHLLGVILAACLVPLTPYLLVKLTAGAS